MKPLISLIVILLFPFFVLAQDAEIKTDSFKVEGNCNMCKKRIEAAAYGKGIKRAEWNRETKMLTVIYRSTKTSPEVFLKRVARAGHNSDSEKASENDYNKLPGCCQYKSRVCND
jgi:periplasmic mercuric ion binding protein